MPGSKARRNRFYLTILDALEREGVPFLLGGGFALRVYTGIERDTKDMDLFLRRDDIERCFTIARRLGYDTKIEADHWLGKIMEGDGLVDLIYSSGNGLCGVDEDWFRFAERDEFLGRGVNVIPPEEMLWSKAFVQDRGRYDGADVAHLILARGRSMDWDRVLRRFDEHWPVLLSHLILYGYVFPSERSQVPAQVWGELTGKLIISLERVEPIKLTRGPYFSFIDYLSDLHLGFVDARIVPHGPLTGPEVGAWTRRLEEQIPGGHPMARRYSRRASRRSRSGAKAPSKR